MKTDMKTDYLYQRHGKYLLVNVKPQLCVEYFSKEPFSLKEDVYL